MSVLRLFRREYVSHREAKLASMAGEIAQLSADYQQSEGYRKQQMRATVTERLDSLLEVLLDTKGVPTRTEVDEAFSQHHPLTEIRLKSLASDIVPLVVIRELISLHEVPVDRQHLSNWKSFSDRYRKCVI